MPSDILQAIADSIFAIVEPELSKYFADYNPTTDNVRTEVLFINGAKLQYPMWLLNRRGKTILNEVYNNIFSSTTINFTTLFKALKKLNMFPKDIVDKLVELKTGANSMYVPLRGEQ
ncbi:MAG: hypothetical protein IPO92_00045 [Saprospiraceae bacterium]|nr:hypothetical protein [Saprospiraceae bacterium]